MLQRAAFLPPCDPISKPRLPTGERWAYELKLDGYRLQLHKFGRRVTIFSRNGHDWTERFPFLAGSLSSLPGSCIIDGELVATEGDGLAPFAAVHRAVHKRTEDNLVVFAFDLMAAAGRDITNETYLERRRRLKELIRRAQLGRLYYSEAFTNGPKLLEECNARGLEGVVAKRRDAPYRSGASGDWIKVKCPTWKAANRDRGEQLFG